MAEQLKLLYNELLISQIATAIKIEYKKFNINSFKVECLNNNWDNLELKDRMHRITQQIYKHIPLPYPEQIEILNKVTPKFKGLTAMLFPNFIEQYGIEYYDISIQALENYTSSSTSEFAIRPFILKYPKKTITKMLKWSTHDNYHVRRLASEGCRPLLPWAMKLHNFVKNPAPIIPILTNLKADKEDYVYRSVANNLNDISKSHPQLVIDLCTKWNDTTNKGTKWLIKHALRTLLKQGNQDAMKLFGFGNIKGIDVKTLQIKDSVISIGSYTNFYLKLVNTSEKAKFRIEYCIYYLKKNGSHSQKVFQIKETTLERHEEFILTKKISFKDLTTRKHYTGKHFLSLKINGNEIKKIEFNLI